jgi:muramoyltetrapeptide carboxypeptidase
MNPRKPPPLRPGDKVRIVAPSSPFERDSFERGITEIERLGLRASYTARIFERDGYFAGNREERAADFADALSDAGARGVSCVRGGYGAGELLHILQTLPRGAPKLLLGFSDATVLDIFLWQTAGWVTIYGPMVGAGFSGGADLPGGYESASLWSALGNTRSGWTVNLGGEALVVGSAEGILLGGCLTLVESMLGTPWELDTEGAVLLLEDRAMKPFQVDRSLLHLRQAGKLDEIRGVILGEFPECDPPGQKGISVRDVCLRHFGEMGIPVVWKAAIGHTARPMLTVPLGVQSRLHAGMEARLEILEPACAEAEGAEHLQKK